MVFALALKLTPMSLELGDNVQSCAETKVHLVAGTVAEPSMAAVFRKPLLVLKPIQ